MKDLKITQSPSTSKIQVEIKKKLSKITDFRLVHKQASILLDRWVQKNFKSQGSDLGSDSWLPFAAKGRWIKGKGLDASAKLLQDTGALRLSHMPFHSKTNAGIGSELPYSKHHQFGTDTIPMRRTLPVESDIRVSLLKLFDRHVKGAL